jgi:phosphoribosylformylglycinamidine cyclo-ligase
MGVETKEMLRTFNCGIGMVVIVKPEITENAVSILNSCGEEAWIVGEIVEDKNNQAKVI